MTRATGTADASSVRAEQLQLLCQQAMRVPLGVIALAAFIDFLMWDYQPRAALAGWTAMLAALMLARSALCARLRRSPPPEDRVARWSAAMTGFSFANGVVGGAAGILFFDGAPLAEQAFLTMVLCCWCAGAIGTTSALPRSFYAFVVPFLAPIVWSWSFSGAEEGVWTAILIALFGAYQAVFVRDNGAKVVDGLRVRLENVHLVEEANRARESAEAASRSKTRFLAAASHDLRQPLHALSLYSAALHELATEPRLQRVASNMEASVESLDNLFEALLDISRLDAGVVRPEARRVELRPLLERLAAEVGPQVEAKGLALRLDAADAAVETDPLLLERILRNLLDNAVRYTPQGHIAVVSRAEPAEAEIAVSDTGVGIRDSDLEHVFEEFYQAGDPGRDARKGLGLGLATVRRLTELLGGRIAVASQPGRGSTFTLRIPSRRGAAPALPPAPAAASAPRPELPGLRVLVIDDDPGAQSAMRELLDAWGCNALVAASADEALRLLDSAAPPDCVLSDYRLANGETGDSAIRAITRRLGPIPALLVTAETDPQRLQEAKASGFPLLHKPLKPSLLRSRLSALAAARGGA